MPDSIQIDIDSSEIKKAYKKLDGIYNGAPKAIVRAMNRSVTGMKTDAGKVTASMYIIKQKDVKDKIEVYKANYSNLTAQIRSTGRPIRAAKFQYSPNTNPGMAGGSPVFLKVKKDSSGGFLTGGHSKAFMASMKNKMLGIFERTGEPSKNPRAGKEASKYSSRKDRENIEQRYGPGVVQMLNNDESKKYIQEKATERFDKELAHQIDYLLSQQ